MTARLVAFAQDLNDALQVLDAERAVAEAERAAVRRAALMAFYIGHLRATGWTLDLDHSNPLTKSVPLALVSGRSSID